MIIFLDTKFHIGLKRNKRIFLYYS